LLIRIMSTAEEGVVASDGLGDANIYIQPKRVKANHVHAITLEQSRYLGISS